MTTPTTNPRSQPTKKPDLNRRGKAVTEKKKKTVERKKKTFITIKVKRDEFTALLKEQEAAILEGISSKKLAHYLDIENQIFFMDDKLDNFEDKYSITQESALYIELKAAQQTLLTKLGAMVPGQLMPVVEKVVEADDALEEVNTESEPVAKTADEEARKAESPTA